MAEAVGEGEVAGGLGWARGESTRCETLGHDGVSGRWAQAACDRTTAQVVRGEARVAFLGRLYGAFKEAVERRTVRALTGLCGGGTLGAWEFVALSTGGGYLRPPVGTYCLRTPTYRAGCVSAEVAGLAASLLALADLCTTFGAEGIFGLRYRQLHAYAVTHPEAGEIFRFVDC